MESQTELLCVIWYDVATICGRLFREDILRKTPELRRIAYLLLKKLSVMTSQELSPLLIKF